MSSHSESRPTEQLTGINVTPLVDVALVLLIVFLTTAQLAITRAIPLDAAGSASPAASSATLSIVIDARGDVSVDGRPLATTAELVDVARIARGRDATVKAVIHAAPSTSHGAVIEAMDALRRAGIEKMTFAIEGGAARDPRAPRSP